MHDASKAARETERGRGRERKRMRVTIVARRGHDTGSEKKKRKKRKKRSVKEVITIARDGPRNDCP